jgi:Flp pilus assembly protein TadG
MPETRPPSHSTALLSRFRRDKRANVAIIFAFALIPILTAIGCATDYTEATRIKAKMQAAADAAAVASVSKNSAAWTAAVNMTSNGPVAAGVTEANNIYNGNVFNFANLYQNGSVTSTVTKTGVNLTSNVQFSAQVPVVFMKVLGWQNMTIGGSSSATSSLPRYIDFYMMLDVSGSMGLPSTSAEAVRMQNINPDNNVQYPTGCTLACHFAQPPLTPLPNQSGNQLQKSACIDPGPSNSSGNKPFPYTMQSTQKYPTGNYCLGYDISRISQAAYAQLLANHGGQLPTYKYTQTQSSSPVAQPTAFYSTSASFPNDPVLSPVSSCPTAGTDACIQLRLDAVGFAVSQLLATATNPAYELIPNEFRVGLYPYITSMYQTYAPLTNSLTGSIVTAANNLAALLDTNTNSNLGSGGTNQDAALSTMNGLITNPGDGSSPTDTLPYVFIITDGAVTPQTKGVPFGGWSGSNHDTVIASPDTNCTAMKSKGIKIAILYIPFQPISPVNASFAGDEDDAANNNIPNIPASLQSCASANFFYTANTPQDITNLLQLMFKQALTEAHVTN